MDANFNSARDYKKLCFISTYATGPLIPITAGTIRLRTRQQNILNKGSQTFIEKMVNDVFGV